MDLGREAANAVREFVVVRPQLLRRRVAAVDVLPAVVRVDVVVSRLQEAAVAQVVGGLEDLVLGDVAVVGVLGTVSVM